MLSFHFKGSNGRSRRNNINRERRMIPVVGRELERGGVGERFRENIKRQGIMHVHITL